jgi:hypothetical protein
MPSPAWTFGGSTGHPLGTPTSLDGSDRIGSFQELDFSYQDVPRSGSIRVYDSRSLTLFASSFAAAGPNLDPFPSISAYPSLPHKQAYANCFGYSQFNSFGGAGDSPWLEFDSQGQGFILSPASHFQVAQTTLSGAGVISSGITTGIAALPAGFTQGTMLDAGSGINGLYQDWGLAMTDLQGKIRPADDDGVTLAKLGYWTDNGAQYYYNYDHTLGYEGTLQAAVKEYAQKGVPVGYLQLDSWWYPKGPTNDWGQGGSGIETYTAAPALFPNGLSAFQQSVGVPLVTHARWIDATSPYRTQYSMSGGVSTDPKYWTDRAGYLAAANVTTYEQDWLCSSAQPVYNLTDPDLFLGGMAAATSAKGMTIQYCMPLPRDYLQSTLYDNVTNMRVSTDHFLPARWDTFLYDSQLASALGVWPFADVLRSTETTNLVLSTLSAGPVAVGDALGAVDAANLAQTVLPDGTIVKPDAAIVPTDETYLADGAQVAGPMVASTYSEHTTGRTLYVFAYARGTATTQSASFTPAKLGNGGPTYVYDYFNHVGQILPAGATYTATVGAGSYFVAAPIEASGIALLGDSGKFVTAGKLRLTHVSDDGMVHASVAFSAGEGPVTLTGYSPTQPTVQANSGGAGQVAYDSTTHLFKVPVTAGPGEAATVTIARA